eukprot:6199207-Pleurochrysis_carterae.AAC.1
MALVAIRLVAAPLLVLGVDALYGRKLVRVEWPLQLPIDDLGLRRHVPWFGRLLRASFRAILNRSWARFRRRRAGRRRRARRVGHSGRLWGCDGLLTDGVRRARVRFFHMSGGGAPRGRLGGGLTSSGLDRGNARRWFERRVLSHWRLACVGVLRQRRRGGDGRLLLSWLSGGLGHGWLRRWAARCFRCSDGGSWAMARLVLAGRRRRLRKRRVSVEREEIFKGHLFQGFPRDTCDSGACTKCAEGNGGAS